MANLKVEKRTVITGDGLKEPVLLREVVTVGGTEFFAVRKTDSAFLRVLTGTTWGKTRPLKDSTLFEKIARLRDTAIDSVAAPVVLMDLDLDSDSQPRKRTRVAIESEFVVVNLPPVGCVDGVKAKVLTRKSLFLECSTEVVNWLVAAFAEGSLADENAEAAAEDCDDAGGLINGDIPKYVSYDKGRKAYRVRYRSTVKWFSSHTCEDPLGEAIAFLATLQNASAVLLHG
jgi:hypothetical protein